MSGTAISWNAMLRQRLFLAVVLGALLATNAAAAPQPVAAVDVCASSNCATVNITFTGSGTAHVIDDDGQLDCSWDGSSRSGTCSTLYVWALFSPSIEVTVTAVPAANSYVNDGGCCAIGQPDSAAIQLFNGWSVTHNFDVIRGITVSGTVNLSGTGAGHATSTPAGIDCTWANGVKSGTCSHTWYFIGTASLVLTFAPSSTSYPCWTNPPGCGSIGKAISSSMSGSTDFGLTVGVAFNLASRLAVAVQGQGTVASNLTGISCPSACVQYFKPGTAVVLTATPADGSYFKGWTGACKGQTSSCQLTIGSTDTSTTALFAKPGTPPPPTPRPSAGSTPPATPRPTTPPASSVPVASQPAGSQSVGSQPTGGAAPTPASPLTALAGSLAPSAGPTAEGPVAQNSSGPDLGTLGLFGLLVLILALGVSAGFLAGRRRSREAEGQ